MKKTRRTIRRIGRGLASVVAWAALTFGLANAPVEQAAAKCTQPRIHIVRVVVTSADQHVPGGCSREPSVSMEHIVSTPTSVTPYWRVVI